MHLFLSKGQSYVQTANQLQIFIQFIQLFPSAGVLKESPLAERVWIQALQSIRFKNFAA